MGYKINYLFKLLDKTLKIKEKKRFPNILVTFKYIRSYIYSIVYLNY